MWWIIGFAFLLLIVWLIAMKMFPHHVTWKEGLIMLAVQSLVIAVIIFGSIYSQGRDVQILNGEVTSKSKDRVHCRHSYQCNCYSICSGSGSSRSCTRVCQTCYEHGFDIDWNVHSNVGSTGIETIDRQGLKEPPRWSVIDIGEPFSVESGYYNYIKASPWSIFNKKALEQQVGVPPYLSVYDYYRINRVQVIDSKYQPDDRLNTLLNQTLAKLGPIKKVNVVVVVHSNGNLYSEALKVKMLGGKINDIYIVFDVDKEGVFNNVAVFSWSKSDLVNVKLRDSLLDIGKWNSTRINQAVKENILKYYESRSIEEFKYLKDEVEIPTWAIWFVMVFGILFPFGAGYIAYKHEIA